MAPFWCPWLYRILNLVFMMNTFYKYAVQPLEAEWRHATIFMVELEETFLSGYPFKPHLITDILTTSLLSGLTALIFYTISSPALTSSTVTSLSLLISPPRQSIFLMSLFTSMEATFPPSLTLSQQTHTHLFHTTVSTQDISSNILSTVNFYVTNAFVLMTKLFSMIPPNY